MYLIVGLGNPGAKYLMTRHNVGFMLIDGLASAYALPSFKQEHKAETGKIRINTSKGSELALIAKPQTFMNLSGESVRALMDYYDISPDKVLVAHDEVDLPFGQFKFQFARGHGGQNGVRNIHQHMGHNKYARLRMGVGRPNGKQQVADYVLSNFSNTEQTYLNELIDKAIDGVECFVEKGWQGAANQFNETNIVPT